MTPQFYTGATPFHTAPVHPSFQNECFFSPTCSTRAVFSPHSTPLAPSPFSIGATFSVPNRCSPHFNTSTFTPVLQHSGKDCALVQLRQYPLPPAAHCRRGSGAAHDTDERHRQQYLPLLCRSIYPLFPAGSNPSPIYHCQDPFVQNQ